jgi:hypothetical protein
MRVYGHVLQQGTSFKPIKTFKREQFDQRCFSKYGQSATASQSGKYAKGNKGQSATASPSGSNVDASPLGSNVDASPLGYAYQPSSRRSLSRRTLCVGRLDQ